jgi:hypothetical protein
MIVTSSAAWDLGISFCIDDEVFGQEIINELKESLGSNVFISMADDPHDSMEVAIGKGLRLNLQSDRLPGILLENAMNELASNKGKVALSCMTITSCFIDLFALGIAYIQLDTRFSPGQDPHAIEEVLVALDNVMMKQAAEYLRETGVKVITTLSKYNWIDNITLRFDLATTDKGYIFPGFSDVFYPEEGDNIKQLETYIKEYNSQTLGIVNTDDGVLYFGWAISAFIPTADAEYSKIICVLKYSQIFNEVCIGYEKLFTRKLKDGLKSKLLKDKKNSLDFLDLQRLRTLASAIDGITCFPSVTEDEDNLSIFRAFDRIANIDARHKRIREASEVFHFIEMEILREKEELRQKQLNTIIFFLTALTFITVFADILTTVDYSNSILPGHWSRFFLLISIPVLGILLIWTRFIRRNK